jgi:hypothetical protein
MPVLSQTNPIYIDFCRLYLFEPIASVCADLNGLLPLSSIAQIDLRVPRLLASMTSPSSIALAYVNHIAFCR